MIVMIIRYSRFIGLELVHGRILNLRFGVFLLMRKSGRREEERNGRGVKMLTVGYRWTSER